MVLKEKAATDFNPNATGISQFLGNQVDLEVVKETKSGLKVNVSLNLEERSQVEYITKIAKPDGKGNFVFQIGGLDTYKVVENYG